MAKATTIKEALTKFEEKSEQKAQECTLIKLIGQQPPLEKMDASLSTLTKCEQLSLSSNCIEKIANLNGLKHLKILSLARNSIKSLTGLEAVGDTLEQLWISYNNIEKLKGVAPLKKLRILYMANNQVKDLSEYTRLADLPCLKVLKFIGNPLQDEWETRTTVPQSYKEYTIATFFRLDNLDGATIVREEDDSTQQQEQKM